MGSGAARPGSLFIECRRRGLLGVGDIIEF
jgi:hypothetical protein